MAGNQQTPDEENLAAEKERFARLETRRKQVKEYNKRLKTVALSEGDRKMLAELSDILGVSDSEAVRTAIRVYWAILKQQ